MKNTGHTTIGATATSEGWLAHVEVFADCGLILAPVKLATRAARLRTEALDGSSWGMPVPLRRDGRLVYALPGGGEFIP